MKATDIIDTLGLPISARVDQRVPKKLLVEHGAPTSADKRQINDGIEEIRWLASLKPTTIGVPEYRDATCEYLEIALLHLILRPGAKAKRLNELVHRAVPYPVWLLTEQAFRLIISMAHKRWSQGEAGKTVLDGGQVEARLGEDGAQRLEEDFLAALSLTRQPRSSLRTLYQGWIDTLLTMQAARLTGAFSPATSREHAATRRAALGECLEREDEIKRLRAAATKERQMARQIELNQQLKRAEAALVAARARL